MTEPPRYQQIARILRTAIADGTHPVGSLLPTEAELCARFDASRHTVRDALRLLAEDGLVMRKRRAGTLVTAPARPPVFVQPLGGVGDLLQYARDARLEIMAYEPAPADGLAARLDLDPAGWWELRGRRVGGRPIGLTRILIRADLAPDRAAIAAGTTVAEVVEQRTGVTADRIDQQISAMILDKDLARLLGTDPGTAALRTLRLYHEADGRLFIASESAHPADRFVYAMRYSRERSHL
ncbi:MAG: hypothetical protein RLY86_3840 [Pseudomonadota bacterium]|jgi:DNA-binding GntR family transcriptional regulator